MPSTRDDNHWDESLPPGVPVKSVLGADANVRAVGDLEETRVHPGANLLFPQVAEAGVAGVEVELLAVGVGEAPVDSVESLLLALSQRGPIAQLAEFVAQPFEFARRASRVQPARSWDWIAATLSRWLGGCGRSLVHPPGGQ